ncbi:MAG: hypothetical protein LBS83_01870 [Holosporales bacterium]|nr:hypothetical protein [Holosporales bacterium]
MGDPVYVKDVTFREDFSVKRKNPFVFSSLIDMELNIMRSNGENNISNTVYGNSLKFKNTYMKYKKYF